MKPPQWWDSSLVPGVAVCANLTAIAWLSPAFKYGSDPLGRPVLLVTTLLVATGAIYLVAVWLILRNRASAHSMTAGILIGLAMRACLAWSTPIQEDDYFRYLWDGAVSAHAINPYCFSTDDVRRATANVSPELIALAQQSPETFARVSFPELRTVYPPVAQAAFALAHWLRPWSIGALRVVFFAFDMATLGLVLLLLRELRTPFGHSLIYWWNPILIKEVYNSVHMDVVALPFALLAVWLTLRQKPVHASVAVAVGTAAKIWPALLLPVLLRTSSARTRTKVAAATAATFLIAALFMPALTAGALAPESGFNAYGRQWEMNDALFSVVSSVSQAIGSMANWQPDTLALVARGLAFLLLIIVLVSTSQRPISDSADLLDRIVIILGAAFMLSPAQFPWYVVCLLPFLALRPRASLLLLTMQLPLYYLKFYFAARGRVDVFHTWIVWAEFGPVLALAAYEWRALRRGRRRTA